MYGLPADVINLMIDAYPKSITVKDNNNKRPLNFAKHNSLLEKLLRVANFPEPYPNEVQDQNKIIIVNMTGRQINVEIREALPRTYVKVLGATLLNAIGFNAAREQTNDPNLGRPAVYAIAPDESRSFSVEGCKGLYFDFFLSNTDDSFGWAKNHLVKKGYAQEVCGQQFKLTEVKYIPIITPTSS
jgi:hypothetical protein